MDSYRTIKTSAEALYKEKGSKFIGLAFHVASDEDIRNHLESLKKQYYDARHHCYAYVTGMKGDKFRANDDGEPNHSAGDPILGQIRSKELTNVLVVVVRYFGGTKLGVPGLINAYKTAAREALEMAETIEVPIRDEIVIDFPYDKTSEVMRLLKEFDVEVVNQTFMQSCSIRGAIALNRAEGLKDKLALAGVNEVNIHKAF